MAHTILRAHVRTVAVLLAVLSLTFAGVVAPWSAALASAASSGGSPFGHLDAVGVTADGVVVQGWAIDPDTTGPIYVWITVDGGGRHTYANLVRSDVARAYPQFGSNHGFAASIDATAGSHRVCATASNVGNGDHTSFGCRTVTVPDNSPRGNLDSVAATAAGTGISISGWATDPDYDGPLYIWITIDGVGQHVLANSPRPDVVAALPGSYAASGFKAELRAGVGQHVVCAAAANVGPGSHTPLGCGTVRTVGEVEAARTGSSATEGTATASVTPPAAPVSSTLVSASRTPSALVIDGVGVSSTPRVFAHYFPPYPISIDNKSPSSDYYTVNYLDPNGEGGKHRSYGGLLRDRPIGRAPLSGDWKGADMLTEVNRAADAGIDGFFVDLLSLSGSNWDRTVDLMEAAAASGRGFVVAPQVDTNASAGAATPEVLAAKLAQLAQMPAAYRLPTGEFVVSSFKAEGKSLDWWNQVLSILRNQYGVRTAFMPVLLNAAYLKTFAPISYAVGNWGVRNPGSTLAGPNYAAQAHSLGTRWIEPVSVQDSRPNQQAYWEAANFAQLRASWQRAIQDGADFVVMNTWNDYSENTCFSPSQSHGYSYSDLSAYYSAWFKSGSAPTIVRDGVYISHRKHPYRASPTLSHSLMILRNGDRNPAQDTVEVTTFLTAPAAVSVTVGAATYTYSAPAGVFAKSFPLQTGAISATATRGAAVIGTASTGVPVTSSPTVQDFQYYADTSRR